MGKKWKAIEPGVWKPEEEGDSIEGVLIGIEPKDEEKSAKYHIENQNGRFFIWGSAILDDRMRYVKVGEEVRITYHGKGKTHKKQDLNYFSVEVAEYDNDDSKDSDVEVESAKESVPEETVQ